MASTETGVLLSPNQRRLWDITAPVRYPTQPAAVTHRNEADAKRTYECLRRAGWTPYDGPAQRDPLGWIIPGTDPRLRPA